MTVNNKANNKANNNQQYTRKRIWFKSGLKACVTKLITPRKLQQVGEAHVTNFAKVGVSSGVFHIKKNKHMFSYYGSKSKIVHLYPPPKFGKIIEPFAGSARYALRFWEHEVLLADKYSVIIDIWNYLINASKGDILGLPNPKRGESLDDFTNISSVEKHFLGFLVVRGIQVPGKKVSSFVGDIGVREDLIRIAKDLYKIRHWKVIQCSYTELENEKATWFIDPPYQFGGERYKESGKNIDYKHLAEWCKQRSGQAIVCENTKANWMDFSPITKTQGSANTNTTEAVWSNMPTNFCNKQIQIIF